MSKQEDSKRVARGTLSRLFVLGLLIFAATAPAEARADAAQNKAKTAFQKGAKLFEAGDYTEAVKAFRAAYEAAPHWKLLYNIAQCEAAAKNYGPALEAFEAYLVSGGDDVPAERQDEIRKEIARLRDLCGDVVVDAPAGSDVFIDDLRRGTTPIAGEIPVGAGMHVVRIVHGGDELLKQEIQVRGAKTVTVRVGDAATVQPGPPEAKPGGATAPEPEPETGPEPPLAETPASPEDGPPNKMVVIGSVLTAVGGAALIAGVVTGAVSRAKTKDLEESCPDKQCTDPGDETLHDQAARLSLATDVMLPVGAAVAVAGVVLVVLGLRGESADEPDAEVTAAAGPGHVGVAFRGRF
ncbi:MAG: tetratricopeptide repeat protein [Proteobacteria bacterium]|nr:tetratricopeptide repeat protein [Pseudomonadota bacterium]